MNGFPVFQQYYAQVLPASSFNFGPTPDSTVLLNHLLFRTLDDMLNPFKLDLGAVWPLLQTQEILGQFHVNQACSIAVSAVQTRSTSASCMAGNSGSVTVLAPTSSACGKSPGLKPNLW